LLCYWTLKPTLCEVYIKSEGVILIGMAGAGKSNLGASLSKSLGFNFIDLDGYILESCRYSTSIYCNSIL